MNKDNGLYIRVSSDLKEAFQKVVEKEGFNVSETLEATMKDVVRRGRVPSYMRPKTKSRKEQVISIPFIKESLDNIVFKNKHIKRASLFGSYATGEATAKSDVDIYLEVDNHFSLFDQAGVKVELQDILKKDVDVITGSDDKVFLDHVNRTKIVLYERGSYSLELK